jgi:hypothetical protein
MQQHVDEDRVLEAATQIRWPDRLLAAAASALIAAWLLATAFGSPPLSPAGAALIAGLTVAALPRIGWTMLSLAAAAGLTVAGRPGAALMVLIGSLVPVVLLVRKPTRWALAATAPALGAVMLAGAWPALAGRDSSAWRRAALGAQGWIWIAFCGLISGRGIYTELPPSMARPSEWMPSLDHAVGRALWPLFHSGQLLPATAWAAGAIVLPWINRGPLPLRVVSIAIWSAALASTTTTMLRSVHADLALRPGAAALGALAGGIIALVPALISRCRNPSASSDNAPGLA